MAKKKKEKSIEDIIEHIRDDLDELEQKVLDTSELEEGDGSLDKSDFEDEDEEE